MNKGEGKYNAVVIGAGTAGLVTAAGTAGLGGRVALVERNRMGGDCLNFGCVPSKALISSARAIEHIRRAQDWGLEEQDPRFNFTDIIERMRERRAKIEPNDSVERFESLGVDVFRGEARFLSPHEVEVDGQKLRAANFVIAAGSRAGAPPIEGLDSVPYYTNETIFDQLNEKPASMLIIGGGPIGTELGQTFNRFGIKVTLLEYGPRILGKEDQDVADFMQQRLEKEGVTVVDCTQVERAAQRDGKIHLEGTRKPPGGSGETVTFEGEVLLIAAGRIPNVETLNLEAAGVKFNKRGIEVNEYLQTSQPHIYAAGDIAGSFQFTHIADVMARVIVRNILMPMQLLRQKTDLSVVPWCTYTDPEVAHVGLGEDEAKAKNIAYDRFYVPVEEADRAIVESEEAGFVKVLTKKGTDQIIGATIVAAHGGDLLQEFVLAMKNGIGLTKIGATIHPYPTMAGVAQKIADQYSRTRLTPRAEKIFRWLYGRARK